MLFHCCDQEEFIKMLYFESDKLFDHLIQFRTIQISPVIIEDYNIIFSSYTYPKITANPI